MTRIPFAVGNGFDVHRFRQEGGQLVLCGIQIPFERGLLAHSDGDVALHALCDALLGAASLRDIGYHFPPSEEAYKDISSKILLAKVVALVKQQGWLVANVDITIMAERPKLTGYIELMRHALSEIVGSDTLISVKATTCEGLGFVGREEGIATFATALLYRNE